MTGIVFSNVASSNYFDNDLRLMDFEQAPDYTAEFSLDFEQPADSLWPRSRLQGADIVNIAPIWNLIWYEWIQGVSGAESKFMVTGIAKDNTGTALSGATVKLYRTSTDEMVGTATSAADGAYWVGTPYTGNHYAVAYKAGSPDVTGATVNTVTGV
jgi:hypothetical protein